MAIEKVYDLVSRGKAKLTPAAVAEAIDAGFAPEEILNKMIGAMDVVGAIQDGIYGDYSVLLAKSILDMIIVAIMAASMGKGCVFSAIPVGIFQGAITILARWIEPLMTEAALANLSLTGSMLIFCVGANMIWGKKFKPANLLPTIVVAIAWSFF